MDWDKLRVFHAVAEAKSFTKAASKLNLSQSAISRQISALEHEMGVSLFHRHARGLVPTEQGDVLFRTVHEVDEQLMRVQGELTESTEKPQGKLRLTTTVGLGSAWLVHHIDQFLKLHPDVDLQLILENEELDLSQRTADCAVRLRLPKQNELIQRRLFTVHFHIYATQEYIEKWGQPKTLEELDNHAILSFGENAPAYLTDINWLEIAGRSPGQPRKARLQINNLIALRKVCEKGMGIAVLPDYCVEKDSPLIRLIPSVEAPSFDTYFVYPAESRNLAKIQALRDFLISVSRSWEF